MALVGLLYFTTGGYEMKLHSCPSYEMKNGEKLVFELRLRVIGSIFFRLICFALVANYIIHPQ
ncbi:hypothetical protein K445DRAFT_320225 [Daldinia sp. EC12]|nr:hypothetical protein K445DRAFT_320225 [Daldinia sp. EC12]